MLAVRSKVFGVNVRRIFIKKSLAFIAWNWVYNHISHTLILGFVFISLHVLDFLVQVVGLVVLLFDSGVLGPELIWVVIAVSVVIVKLSP